MDLSAGISHRRNGSSRITSKFFGPSSGLVASGLRTRESIGVEIVGEAFGFGAAER